MERKCRIAVTVQGRRHQWGFTFDADPQYLEEWRSDGLDVHEVLTSVTIEDEELQQFTLVAARAIGRIQ